ncbi:hypothetical protein EV121DRAFT_297178 [Schizophyllum commune]
MRDPERRRASKRAYYERNKAKLQAESRARYARERESRAKPQKTGDKRRRARKVDHEKRKESKQAYYQRNKALMRQKARERMSRIRSSHDAAALRARMLASRWYRAVHGERVRIRRLNLYRKHWIDKRGVTRFLKDFRGRAKTERGELLEHYDHGTLTSALCTPENTK